MKENAKESAAFFRSRSCCFFVFASTGTIAVLHVSGAATDGGEYAGCFLLPDYIAAEEKSDSYWQTFAHSLAAMDRADCASFSSGKKSILSMRGTDKCAVGFADRFFRECRLAPQFKKAFRYFRYGAERKHYKTARTLGNFYHGIRSFFAFAR